jgi:hypothetical protein
MGSRATREIGLQRIGTATRFLAVGAVVAGGILSAAVAKALPGRSNHPASSGTISPAPTYSSSNSGGDAGQGINSTPLSPPVQAPAPSNNAPIVSSGAS